MYASPGTFDTYDDNGTNSRGIMKTGHTGFLRN